ncbi:type I-E CRISPR-associated protein Cse1/CasA [Tessaracoccus lubricantis]|uniref:Type I-E CRISPR-associated protein Cse1/CasA n=1 Tax=Tessaracoccus lubricantis TaxID=545543 RepID=A0ABP9FH46_9ACTN
MSFDLLEEAWIPVSFSDGESVDLSLRRIFRQADKIRRISCDLPTQSFAVLRVLLAIAHDAIGFRSPDSIIRAAEQGLDTDAIDSYLDRYSDRFDLFHPTRPFMQVATLRTAKGEVSGLEKLISDVPNREQFLTVRAGRGLEVITAADAARWLIHCQAFDPAGIRSGAVGDPEASGGRGYPIGPAWAGQIGGVILHGRSLAETIVYNLAPTRSNPDDRPVWALDEPHTQLREMEPEIPGPLTVLTWQSRRIRLAGDRDGVTGVVLAQGDKMTPQNRRNVEHMTSWRFSEPQTKKHGIDVYMPMKHDPERSGWRGAPHLIQRGLERDGRFQTLPSATIENLSVLQEQLRSHHKVQVEIVGIDYGPQEATVAELVHDQLDLQVALLGTQGAAVRTMVNDAVGLANDCVYALGRLAGNLAAASGDFDGIDGAQNRAKLTAWSMLDAPARDWLASLNADTDTIEAKREWSREIRLRLEELARELVNGCSPAAVIGRKTKHGFLTASKAEAFFHHALRKELPLAYETTPRSSHER